MTTKTCSACKNEKDVAEFSKDSRLKHGRQGRCKACYKIYWLKRKEKVPSKEEPPKKTSGLSWVEGIRILTMARPVNTIGRREE